MVSKCSSRVSEQNPEIKSEEMVKEGIFCLALATRSKYASREYPLGQVRLGDRVGGREGGREGRR
jgi:hypothetical protein